MYPSSEKSTPSNVEARGSCSSCEGILPLLKETRNLCLQNRKSNDIIHKEILKLQHEIKYLKSTQLSAVKVNSKNQEFNNLPFKTIQNLNDFEMELTEQGLKDAFTLFLNNLGGVSYKNSLQIMLRRVLSPEVGILFSLKGRKDLKLKFESLEIFSCIKSK